MELSPFWLSASHAATEERPNILWYPKVHYRVHNSPPLVTILNKIQSIPPYRRVLISFFILQKWSISLIFFIFKNWSRLRRSRCCVSVYLPINLWIREPIFMPSWHLSPSQWRVLHKSLISLFVYVSPIDVRSVKRYHGNEYTRDNRRIVSLVVFYAVRVASMDVGD
jgi:hypothetical protein